MDTYRTYKKKDNGMGHTENVSSCHHGGGKIKIDGFEDIKANDEPARKNSTNAIITVLDPVESEHISFFKHWDGYPEGVMPILKEFIKDLEDGKIRDNVHQCNGWLFLYGLKQDYEDNVGRMSGAEKIEDAWSHDIGKDMTESWKAGPIEPIPIVSDNDFYAEYYYSINIIDKTIMVREGKEGKWEIIYPEGKPNPPMRDIVNIEDAGVAGMLAEHLESNGLPIEQVGGVIRSTGPPTHTVGLIKGFMGAGSDLEFDDNKVMVGYNKDFKEYVKTEKVNPPKPTKISDMVSLEAESQKYNSAEEFIKAYPKVFRTEKADAAYKGKTAWGQGKYFSLDKQQAKEMTSSPHTEKSTGGVVDEYIISPSAKIKEIDISWDSMKPAVFNKFPRGNDLKKQILKEGYDGVILKTDGDLNLGGDQLVMYKNIKSIKTKSQLTDVWNRANKKTPKKAKPKKNPTQPPTKWSTETKKELNELIGADIPTSDLQGIVMRLALIELKTTPKEAFSDPNLSLKVMMLQDDMLGYVYDSGDRTNPTNDDKKMLFDMVAEANSDKLKKATTTALMSFDDNLPQQKKLIQHIMDDNDMAYDPKGSVKNNMKRFYEEYRDLDTNGKKDVLNSIIDYIDMDSNAGNRIRSALKKSNPAMALPKPKTAVEQTAQSAMVYDYEPDKLPGAMMTKTKKNRPRSYYYEPMCPSCDNIILESIKTNPPGAYQCPSCGKAYRPKVKEDKNAS